MSKRAEDRNGNNGNEFRKLAQGRRVVIGTIEEWDWAARKVGRIWKGAEIKANVLEEWQRIWLLAPTLYFQRFAETQAIQKYKDGICGFGKSFTQAETEIKLWATARNHPGKCT